MNTDRNITRPGQLVPGWSVADVEPYDFEREAKAERMFTRVIVGCIVACVLTATGIIAVQLTSAYQVGGWYGERYHAPAVAGHVL